MFPIDIEHPKSLVIINDTICKELHVLFSSVPLKPFLKNYKDILIFF